MGIVRLRTKTTEFSFFLWVNTTVTAVREKR
jgi:hypothetical protein